MVAIKTLWIIGQLGFRTARLGWRAARQLGIVLWREA
jgi:hypothetical protein